MSKRNNRPGGSLTDEVLVSTDLVEDKLKSEFWREATRPFYEVTQLVGMESSRLEGTMRSRRVAGVQFGSVTFNAQLYNRDRRTIARSGLDHYLVAIVTAGDMLGDFAGTSVTARSGDICILDLAQVLQSQVAAGGMFSALIPRGALAKAIGHANLHGRLLKAHLPMTRLLTAYLRGLSDLNGALSTDEGAAVQEALVTILAAALRGEVADDTEDFRPLSVTLRQSVLDFIDHNINNPNLTPDYILRRFNVSRAHLYRAFAEDGGILSAIRDRRLDAAFLELTRADAAHRSISNIASTLGFSNATHFLRRFRERFGLTPSEARREGPASSHQPSDLQAHFLELRRKSAGGQPETPDIQK